VFRRVRSLGGALVGDVGDCNGNGASRASPKASILWARLWVTRLGGGIGLGPEGPAFVFTFAGDDAFGESGRGIEMGRPDGVVRVVG
jgi:hypothetical protein